MAAAAISLLFGLAVAASGAALARQLDADDPPFALGAGLALACVTLVGTNVAALMRFEPWAPAATWLLLLGLAARFELRPGADRRCATGRALVGIVAIALAVPALVLPLPLDTDAQGFGVLALTVRDGGTLDTLAPLRAGIKYLYSPGAPVLFATVSRLSGAGLPAVMMGVSHACAMLFIWLAWELGAELGGGERQGDANRRWASATMLSAALSVGFWTALLDSH